MSDFKTLYQFKNGELLREALTHKSYDADFNNDRLECLGDALLDLIAAEIYFDEGLSAGGITEKRQTLVSDEALSYVSVSIGLDCALLLGKGYTPDSKDKAVSSVYEAYIAAVYLDGGIEAARRVALATLAPAPDSANYVGLLQELLQGKGQSLPEAEECDEGNEQNHIWRVTLTVCGRQFSGTGKNKNVAKRQAAKAAYEYLKNN